MTDRLPVRCIACGNAIVGRRLPYEPKEAVEIQTPSCGVCCAENTFFVPRYYDGAGREIEANHESILFHAIKLEARDGREA